MGNWRKGTRCIDWSSRRQFQTDSYNKKDTRGKKKDGRWPGVGMVCVRRLRDTSELYSKVGLGTIHWMVDGEKPFPVGSVVQRCFSPQLTLYTTRV